MQCEALFDYVNVTSNERVIVTLDGMPMDGSTLKVQKLSDALAGQGARTLFSQYAFGCVHACSCVHACGCVHAFWRPR